MIVIDLWDSKQKKLVLSLFLFGEDNENSYFQYSLMKQSKLTIFLNINGPNSDPQTFLSVSIAYPESSEIRMFLFTVTLLLT